MKFVAQPRKSVVQAVGEDRAACHDRGFPWVPASSGNASQVNVTADSQIDSIPMLRQSLAGRPIAARGASYAQPADAARVVAADALAPCLFPGLRCACDLRPHPTIDVAASPGVRPDATGIDLVMCGSVMGAGGPAEGKGLPFGRADQVTTHVSRDRGVVGGQ